MWCKGGRRSGLIQRQSPILQTICLEKACFRICLRIEFSLLQRKDMPIYKFPGLVFHSRYQWSPSSVVIAAVIIVCLFVVLRWFNESSAFRYPIPAYQRQALPLRSWRPLPTGVFDHHPRWRPRSPIASEAFELQEQSVSPSRGLPERFYRKPVAPKRRRLTRAQRRRLIEQQRGRCGICGKAMAEYEVHVDHRVPLCLQHMHPSTDLNGDWNLEAICVLCHAIKCADERQRGLYQHRR